MQEHEYALIGGINRSKLGRYLSMVAAGASAAIVFILLTLVDIAKQYNLPANLPPVVLSLVGAGSVFTAIYWFFDRYGWKFPKVGVLLKVPNLSGTWQCKGQTINPDKSLGYTWDGLVTIVQTWDRIRIHLATKNSSSDSVSAALICDEVDGFLLLYHYRNNPLIDAKDLTSHYGFSELKFNKDRTSATGDYFNGHGRFTFGTMQLKRL